MSNAETKAARIMRNPSAYGVGVFRSIESARNWIRALGGEGKMLVLMGDHDGTIGTYLTAEGSALGALRRAGYEIA